MSADTALVAELRSEVLAALSARERELAAAGRPPLGRPTSRLLGRQLIAEALERRANEALRDRSAVLSVPEEDELSRAVFDALFRLNRLQRLLGRPGRSRTSTPTAATRCGSATPTVAGSRWSRSPAPTRSWKRCCAPRRLAPGSASAASTAARRACRCSCPTGRGCSR